MLHALGDPRGAREAVRALEFMIPEARPDTEVVVHDTSIPLPRELAVFPWDLIVLGPTFLCARYNESLFARTLREFEWVRDSRACKVALPQDDYDCSAILDGWMSDWSVDYIYSVCTNNWDVLYPRSSQNSEIRLGYTAYISDEWIRTWVNPKPTRERTIDVSYRAARLPANFGRIGQLKSNIAQAFLDCFPPATDRVLDISTDPLASIPGVAWHRFMENSKFCLVAPSGSSILDPWNEIRGCVRAFTALRRNATFEEIEKHCFPGMDGEHVFTAISPRNIEAALAQTVQIAVEDSYSGLLEPYEHYIPLDKNCSNIDEVVAAMDDHALTERLRIQTKEAILSTERIRAQSIVSEILSLPGVSSTRMVGVESARVEFERVKRVHDQKVLSISEKYWKHQRLKARIKRQFAKIGAGRVRDILRMLLRHRSRTSTPTATTLG